MFPGMEKRLSGPFTATQTLAKGTVLAVVTATGKLSAYVNGGAGGLGVAVGILEFPVTVDAAGLIFLGSETAAANVRLTPLREAPYFIAGCFDADDLTGYHADVLTDLKARKIGIAAQNIVYIP